MRSLVITLITIFLVIGFHFVTNANGDVVGNNQTKTLIDFNTYDTNIVEEYTYANYYAPGTASEVNTANSGYTSAAESTGGQYVSPSTPNAMEAVSETGNFLSLGNWRVVQNPSATNPFTLGHSNVRSVKDTDGNNVLGARVTFPRGSFASHAVIEPAFEFLPYRAAGFTAEGAGDVTLAHVDHDMTKNVGVIWNVGKMRSVTVDVCGRGYRNGFSVVLRDINGEKYEYFMGYLDFIGWKTLEWVNVDYTTFVDLERVSTPPVYPIREPYLVLDSFIIHRYDGSYGSDFVVYVRNVKINYDWSIPPTVLRDLGVNDDEWWDVNRDTYVAQYRAMREYCEGRFRLYNDELARKGQNFINETDREAGTAGVD